MVHWAAEVRENKREIIYIVRSEALKVAWLSQTPYYKGSVIVSCNIGNNDFYPPKSLRVRKQGATGSDEKKTCFHTPLSNWEQVGKQGSVTAPRCALKNGSNNLVCQRGTPALLSPALCKAVAILAASRPLLGCEHLQRKKFVYINKYLRVQIPCWLAD